MPRGEEKIPTTSAADLDRRHPQKAQVLSVITITRREDGMLVSSVVPERMPGDSGERARMALLLHNLAAQLERSILIGLQTIR